MGTLPFLPSQSGLHYDNSWPEVPDLRIPTPFGPLAIGNAANGLCGGMVFAVRDLFEAHDVPPGAHRTPDPDSPAFAYIVSRLFDSFDIPAGVGQYYLWMTLPAHNTWFGPHGTSWRTIREEMPRLRATIDAGHPCPLGLVQVQSTNPGDLGRNHQVLAYGYEDNGSTTTVRIYDPNFADDDGVTISFDNTHPDHTTDFVHSRRTSPSIFGFFTTPYSPRNPAPLFSSTTTWVGRPGAANDVGACEDAVWVVGTNAVPGGYGIYRWNGSDWDGVDGGAVRIAVAPDGSPWVVNDAGAIYRRVGAQWQQQPGAAHDIAVGGDGSVWVVGTDATMGGYGIYVWAQNGQWDRIDGGATDIAVTGKGMPWVVNNAHGIYERR